MNKTHKILIWVSAILMLALGTYYFTIPKAILKILFAEPRKPKLEIVETNDIGWWPHQECLKIDSFQVEFVESELNLFNSKSLIKYTVKGKLSHKDSWRPYINHIHPSHRFLRRHDTNIHPYLGKDTINTPEAMIEISPVIKVKNDDKYKGEEIPFEFTNEIKLESFHWGQNWIRFQCYDKWDDLVFMQMK